VAFQIGVTRGQCNSNWGPCNYGANVLICDHWRNLTLYEILKKINLSTKSTV